jgi:glycosyltransferase involved in cell wall biosynthesis
VSRLEDSLDRYDLTLRGRSRPGVRLQFYGMLQGCYGISNVCTQLALAMTSRLEGVALHSYNGGDFFASELLNFAGVDNQAPVGFFYGFPHEIAAPFYRHPIRIGGFVCETDRIDARWVEVCNSLHLIVVPSTWCRRAFVDSGVRAPVLVVPHGLEPEYRPVAEKRRSTPLVFFDTFHESSQLERKGAEELIRSFLRAFGPTGERCVLRLRTDLSRPLVDLRLRYDFGRAIRLDPRLDLSTAEFARIYSEVHCTVHVPRGEGFGLIPFQSIACETPVIAPAVTGMADFLDESNALCVRTAGSIRGSRAGHGAGHYFRIDEQHLVELLHEAHDNWEREYDKVRRAAPRHRERYRWSRVLEDLLEILSVAVSLESGEEFSEFVAGLDSKP